MELPFPEAGQLRHIRLVNGAGISPALDVPGAALDRAGEYPVHNELPTVDIDCTMVPGARYAEVEPLQTRLLRRPLSGRRAGRCGVDAQDGARATGASQRAAGSAPSPRSCTGEREVPRRAALANRRVFRGYQLPFRVTGARATQAMPARAASMTASSDSRYCEKSSLSRTSSLLRASGGPDRSRYSTTPAAIISTSR